MAQPGCERLTGMIKEAGFHNLALKRGTLEDSSSEMHVANVFLKRLG